MIDRLITMLEKEKQSKIAILLSGTISDYVQYRTVIAEYKMLDLTVELAKEVEGSDPEDD